MDLDEAIEHSKRCLSVDVTLKSFQREVIESYVNGSDCYCVAGTGCGKSLTYILCPLVLDFKRYGKSVCVDTINSVVLIIQPLKALMKDQVSKLKSLGLRATYVGEEHDYDGMKGQSYNYIISSPETAVSSTFRDLLETLRTNIVCIFVDESHCIQSLGQSIKKKGKKCKEPFRECYGQLGKLRSTLTGKMTFFGKFIHNNTYPVGNEG